MELDTFIKEKNMVVLDSGLSIPPTDSDHEVMFIQYIPNDNRYEVLDVDYSNADMSERVIKSVFDTNEDLNGAIQIGDFELIIRVYSDGYHKDYNDPRIDVPLRRISILLNETINIECNKLEESLNQLDRMFYNHATRMVK